MRFIELLPGVKSSALGFGCSTLFGAGDARKATRAINVALEVGINHFDLARSYELGAAEAWVGRILCPRRDQVTLVTKFGLRPRPWAAALRPLKPVVRQLRSALHSGPTLAASGPPTIPRGGGNHFASLQYQRVPMTAAGMRGSLETSLRAMRTDYVDLLLMHEPPAIERWDELRACADELKRAGKIRGWGLASPTVPESVACAGLDVIQTSAESGVPEHVKWVSQYGGKGLILYSPLRGSAAAEAAVRLRALWHSFPRAVVLCSMLDPLHIRGNAELT